MTTSTRMLRTRLAIPRTTACVIMKTCSRWMSLFIFCFRPMGPFVPNSIVLLCNDNVMVHLKSLCVCLTDPCIHMRDIRVCPSKSGVTNEANANRRWKAFHLDGLDGGNVSFQTLHQYVAVVTCTI